MKTNKPREYTSELISDLIGSVNSVQYEKTKVRMELAARIADLISERGWKKSEFASKLNKQPSEVTKWLSGTHNFTVDTLGDIASVLGISFNDLFSKPDLVTKYVLEVKVTADPSTINIMTPSLGSFAFC
jgi:ribosome-binding protein aMBF1 (putative translation factor)